MAVIPELDKWLQQISEHLRTLSESILIEEQ